MRVACSWASTCQTIGMNIGYFTSFTAFLALNDAGFCNKYLRRAARGCHGHSQPDSVPAISGAGCTSSSPVGIALFKREVNFPTQKGEGLVGRLDSIHGIARACYCEAELDQYGCVSIVQLFRTDTPQT